jgi:hypothetical protein
MAGRQTNQFFHTHERKPVRLYAIAVGAGAGADMTMQYWNPSTQALATAPAGGAKGIKSVAYNAATGKYKINLQDTYQRLLGFSITAQAVDGSTAPTTPTGYIESITPGGATPNVAIVVTNAAGTATAPTTNCRFYFTLDLSDSNTP